VSLSRWTGTRERFYIAASQQELLALQRESLELQRHSVDRQLADAATSERQRGGERLREGIIWLLAAVAVFSLLRNLIGY
jgi:hypothetical protein